MSLETITVSVQQKTTGNDGAGGRPETWSVVRGLGALKATRNYYRRQSQMRDERAPVASSMSGAGVASQTLVFFTFSRPAPYTAAFPAIQREMRIVEEDGTAWNVILPPRVYEETMQVDCEIVR